MRVLGNTRALAFALVLAVAIVIGVSTFVPAGTAASPEAKCLIVSQRTDVRYPTLQAANDAPETIAGDTIMVKGTCFGTTTIDKDITVSGKSNPGFGVATLDGDDAGTVVTIAPAATVVITGLRITHGVGDSASEIHPAGNSGGGIFNDAGTLTLDHVVVTENIAGNGGGIYNNLGSLEVSNSVVAENTANSTEPPIEFVTYRGAGIFNGGCHPFISCSTSAETTVTRSAITGNAGGGIVNGYAGTIELDKAVVARNTGGGIGSHGHVTISSSLLAQNTSEGSGGGLFVGRFGGATIADTIVTGNDAADSGGGIAAFLAGISLERTVVAANTAVSRGGGIVISGGGGTLVGSVVTGNRLTSPDASGGGIYVEDGFLSLVDSIVRGNIPDDVVEVPF